MIMRKDILDKKEEVEKMILENKPKAEICRILDCKTLTLENYLKKWNIEYKGNMGRKGIPNYEGRRDINDYLNNFQQITTHQLKLKLIDCGLKEHKCENCQLTEWLGDLIPIELHHIDGNRFNNNLDNLQILCPNCHSKTDNNSGKKNKKSLEDKVIKKKYNYHKKKEKVEKVIKTKLCSCGKEISKNAKQCKKCVGQDRLSEKRPDYEVLIKEIVELGYCATGRKYGVSDNCVRKWKKNYEKISLD